MQHRAKRVKRVRPVTPSSLPCWARGSVSATQAGYSRAGTPVTPEPFAPGWHPSAGASTCGASNDPGERHTMQVQASHEWALISDCTTCTTVTPPRGCWTSPRLHPGARLFQPRRQCVVHMHTRGRPSRLCVEGEQPCQLSNCVDERVHSLSNPRQPVLQSNRPMCLWRWWPSCGRVRGKVGVRPCRSYRTLLTGPPREGRCPTRRTPLAPAFSWKRTPPSPLL